MIHEILNSTLKSFTQLEVITVHHTTILCFCGITHQYMSFWKLIIALPYSGQ